MTSQIPALHIWQKFTTDSEVPGGNLPENMPRIITPSTGQLTIRIIF